VIKAINTIDRAGKDYCMISIGNVITRIPVTSMERFVKMVLNSAPALDKDLYTGDVFRIGVLITAKNVGQTVVLISFEPELVQLVDSPREVELESGSYEIEAEWLLKALKATSGTTIKVECKADDMPQIVEFPLRIMSSDE
jgi:hypothetical protein